MPDWWGTFVYLMISLTNGRTDHLPKRPQKRPPLSTRIPPPEQTFPAKLPTTPIRTSQQPSVSFSVPASSNIAPGSAAKPPKENPLLGARNDRLSWPTTLNACSGPWGAPSYCTSLQPLGTANSYPCHEPTEIPSSQTTAGEGIVQALRQVVNTPKIEYLHFNGDPLKYTTFVHNFENCLEKDNPDEARKLKLLIQHCTGKAKEVIESCVNVPSGDGYRVAKETLHENSGKSHVIVEAHITKLMVCLI